MTNLLNKALPILVIVLGSAFTTLMALPLYSNNGNPNAHTMRVVILESSTISINGKSNINHFTCVNTEPVALYSQEVSYKSEQQQLFFKNAFLKIASNTFDCGIRKLTEDFKELVKADQYPNLEITLHAINNNKNAMMSSLTIGIAGVQKAVKMPIVVDRTDGIIKVRGSISLYISDFGLHAPTKLFGMIKVDDMVKIDFELHIAEQSVNQ